MSIRNLDHLDFRTDRNDIIVHSFSVTYCKEQKTRPIFIISLRSIHLFIGDNLISFEIGFLCSSRQGCVQQTISSIVRCQSKSWVLTRHYGWWHYFYLAHVIHLGKIIIVDFSLFLKYEKNYGNRKRLYNRATISRCIMFTIAKAVLWNTIQARYSEL